MNKQDIIKRLTNTQLDVHERESLSQLLHYLHAEGVNNTSSNSNNNSHKRSSTSSNRKGNKHTSSNNKHTR
jgi:hypothetical protein